MPSFSDVSKSDAVREIASKFKAAFREELAWVQKDIARIPGMYHDEIAMLGTLSGGSTTSAQAGARMLINLEKPIQTLTNGMALADNPKMKIPQAINARKPEPIKSKDKKGRIEGVEHLGSCITLYQTARQEVAEAGITDLKVFL